jgi:HK97 family phage major capsid protein
VPTPTPTIDAPADELEQLTRKIAEVRQDVAVTGDPGQRSHLAFLIDRRDRLREGRVVGPTETRGRSFEEFWRIVQDNNTPLDDIPDLTPEERQALAVLNAPAPAPFSTRGTTAPARPSNGYVLEREHRMTDWARDRDPQSFDRFEGLSLGKLMRGMATGSWQDAAEERAALAEGATGTGGAFIPTPLSVDVVDLARNKAQVLAAGARTIPMETSTYRIPRWATDPTPGWLGEAGTVSESEPTVDSLTLTAQMLTFLVKASRQVLEDSGPDMTNELKANMAKVIALELDRVALRGTGTAPQPHGILGSSGITTTTLGAGNGLSLSTGTPPPAWDPFVDAAQAVMANNFNPGAVIMASRTIQSLAKTRDTQGRYLEPPPLLDVNDPQDDRAQHVVPLISNQIPVSLTVGTSVDCSEAYTAQWDRLAIGLRSQFSLLLSERYSDVLQYGFIIGLRADIALLRPGAFAVTLGIRP